MVNYTFPDGGGQRRLTIENNATQPSCAGVGAELGNNFSIDFILSTITELKGRFSNSATLVSSYSIERIAIVFSSNGLYV